MGEFEVILGDCLEVLKSIETESVDFIFADPPYHLSNGGFTVQSGRSVSVNKGEWDSSQGLEFDLAFHEFWLEQCQRVLTANGTIAVSGTSHSIFRCGYLIEKLGYKILNDIVWYKPNAAPNLSGRQFAAAHETVIWAAKDKKSKHIFNYEDMKKFPTADKLKNDGKQMRDVWTINTSPMREKTFGKHPTQKPLELMERLILAATNPGDLVLDPFCGSGTTGVASVRHKRRFVGIEMSEEYASLSKQRIHGELH
jgi:site-specific DNA-methyltransferase (adenine-specific)